MCDKLPSRGEWILFGIRTVLLLATIPPLMGMWISTRIYFGTASCQHIEFEPPSFGFFYLHIAPIVAAALGIHVIVGVVLALIACRRHIAFSPLFASMGLLLFSAAVLCIAGMASALCVMYIPTVF